MDPAFVLSTMLDLLEVSRLDRHLSRAELAVAYAPVAVGLARVAKTPRELAALEALGEAETHFASLVLYGHCDQMPAGERCDNGTSRSPWQLKERACRSGWALPVGTVEAFEEQASCALFLLYFNARRGRAHAATPLHAAFAGYGARPWSWPGADHRARRVYVLEAAIARRLAASARP